MNEETMTALDMMNEKIELRLSKEDHDLLLQIAEGWRCSKSDVMRRALIQLAEQLGILKPRFTQVMEKPAPSTRPSYRVEANRPAGLCHASTFERERQ